MDETNITVQRIAADGTGGRAICTPEYKWMCLLGWYLTGDYLFYKQGTRNRRIKTGAKKKNG